MVKIVANQARQYGLSKDATIAGVAAMLAESGGDPKIEGDKDRHGVAHSIGLFQLNFDGGEGTASGLTREQAKDPYLNARVALRYFKHYDKPIYSAGLIAKFAQKPGDPLYVEHVNDFVAEAKRLLSRTYSDL